MSCKNSYNKTFLYLAIQYPNLNTSDFLSSALLSDQAAPVAALAVVGLFAACLSTTNAQIFALGSETRSLLKGTDKSVMLKTRLSILFFTVVVLVFSTLMGNELALLAKVSFTGTSMIAPVVFGTLRYNKPPMLLVYISAGALLLFLLSILQVISDTYGDWRLDMMLYVALAISTSVIFLVYKKNDN